MVKETLKIFSLILLIILLMNCKGSLTNNNTNVSDTTGYYAARNMQGLASFKIGESSYKNTINQLKQDVRRDSKTPFISSLGSEEKRYRFYDNKHAEYKFDMTGNEISDIKYVENFSLVIEEKGYVTPFAGEIKDSKIKEIKMSEYYVDDVEIRDLRLTFYNDTLYSIYCTQNDDIDEAFTQKYGKDHIKKELKWITPFGLLIVKNKPGRPSKNAELISSLDEKKWENSKMIAESYSHGIWENGKSMSYDYYFTVKSKNEITWSKITNYQDSIYNAYKAIEKNKNQKTIDKL